MLWIEARGRDKKIDDSRFRILPQQLQRLRHAEVSPVHLVGVHLGVNESRVVRRAYVAVLDGRDAGRAAFELTSAQFLRGRVDHLPAPVHDVQVGPGHPNFVPHVVVPAKIAGVQKTCV